jgi:glycosyltransferase involved in cell wall biosynthesis
MKNVVHLGPVGSPGGMSSVINLLVENPPDGWRASSIPTHSEEGILEKILAWKGAKTKLKRLVTNNEVDVAHFHVTHSMSWWRKRNLMGVCSRHGVPSVVHIHSGRFDNFCKRFAGGSVKRTLGIEGRKTVVLEHRWLNKLGRWIPDDAEVIANPCKPTSSKEEGHVPSELLRLLMLSRADRMKGHGFAVKVLDSLRSRGVSCSLKVTGWKMGEGTHSKHEGVEALGWVSDLRKSELISESDFLLMPSSFEGSSMAVIESVVNGLPCICSPACYETIGIPSLVLDLNDPEDWAERIIELSNPNSYREIVSQLGVNSTRFLVDDIRKEWGVVYGKLVSLL